MLYASDFLREKGIDLSQSYDQQKIQKSKVATQNATEGFDYTMLVDQPRTVSWSNYSYPISMLKPVCGHPTFPLT